jgi:hypothetical protein
LALKQELQNQGDAIIASHQANGQSWPVTDPIPNF